VLTSNVRGGLVDDAFSTSARFTVPAFFIVSGFLLKRGYDFTRREFEFKPFRKGKFFSLIIPSRPGT